MATKLSNLRNNKKLMLMYVKETEIMSTFRDRIFRL